MRIRFGDCVFDSLTRQVVRGGRPLALSPKAFELLAALLLGRPRALSRAELRDRLWPSTFVSYSALSRVVNEVRGAIGDHGQDPPSLRTVRGFGYAFAGRAFDLTDEALPKEGICCGLYFDGRMFWLTEGEHLIGRGSACFIRIDSPQISRQHARIRVDGAAALLEDLGSKNGTYVKGEKVSGEVRLTDGDQICLGPALLVFRMGAPGSTETRRSR